MKKPAKFLAFAGIIIGSLLLVTILVVNKWAITLTSRVYELPDHMLASDWHVNNDAATVARGAHLVSAVLGCADCHGDDYAGKTIIHDRAFGTVAAANLTDHARTDTDADWVRAIRYGLRADGRGLWMMPQKAYAYLTDNDLQAVIAYFRSLPTIKRDQPSHRLSPYGRLAVALGKASLVDIESKGRIVSSPATVDIAPAEDATYGNYLARIARCHTCHGEHLQGGPPADRHTGLAPVSLTRPAFKRWHEIDFFRAMRDGRRPDGSELDAAMPWRFYTSLTDLELRALWSYLVTQ